MPEVYHLTNVHNPFDARIFYKQAQTLARAGYAVTVVGPGAEARCGEWAGVRVQTLPVARRGGQRFLNLWRLLRVGLRADADYFHFHDPELLPVGAVLRLCGRRVIYDVHEHFPLVVMVRPWVPSWLRRPFSRLVDWGERLLARYFVTAVVGVVEEQGDRFASRPFAVVKNFPRLEWFSPGCRELGPCALVHIGSLSEDRGGLFLLEIMRELADTHPQVRLLSIGEFHSQELRARFEARLRAWGLEEQIHYSEKRVPYDELGAAIAACQIGLVPGQVSPKNLASFVPTKLFEYFACGLPVVASDLPSIRRFRAVADWGLLADPHDPAAHARAIGCLLDDPGAARAKGAQARRAAEEHFNWGAEAEKLLALYERIAPRKGVGKCVGSH